MSPSFSGCPQRRGNEASSHCSHAPASGVADPILPGPSSQTAIGPPLPAPTASVSCATSLMTVALALLLHLRRLPSSLSLNPSYTQ